MPQIYGYIIPQQPFSPQVNLEMVEVGVFSITLHSHLGAYYPEY